VEDHRFVRRRGFHIFETIGSQMKVWLSASSDGRPLSPRKIPGAHFCRGWVDPKAIVQLEGLGQLKNSMTSSGMEPASFRLVAYCLNQISVNYKIYRPYTHGWQVFEKGNTWKALLKGSRASPSRRSEGNMKTKTLEWLQVVVWNMAFQFPVSCCGNVEITLKVWNLLHSLGNSCRSQDCYSELLRCISV
jgi:hypothetical protein